MSMSMTLKPMTMPTSMTCTTNTAIVATRVLNPIPTCIRTQGSCITTRTNRICITGTRTEPYYDCVTGDCILPRDILSPM